MIYIVVSGFDGKSDHYGSLLQLPSAYRDIVFSRLSLEVDPKPVPRNYRRKGS